MRISDWSSDVCSSDLPIRWRLVGKPGDSWFSCAEVRPKTDMSGPGCCVPGRDRDHHRRQGPVGSADRLPGRRCARVRQPPGPHLQPLRVRLPVRSEEHTSELQSLMRISYAVFCLKKKKKKKHTYHIRLT